MKKTALMSGISVVFIMLLMGTMSSVAIPQAAADYVSPSVEAVIDGTYPISRGLYMYTDGEPVERSLEKYYIDFILSPMGQAIVAEESFVHVKDVGLVLGDNSTQELVIEGSTTVQPIATAAAEWFMNLYDNKDLTVTGTGSSSGLASLIAGTVDIAMASRGIKESEILDLPNYQEFVVAGDGIGIIVNPTNNVTELTFEDLASIYLGDITNWNEVGGPDEIIDVVNRDASSGTRGFFQEFVLDDADFGTGFVEQNSNGAVHDYVATNDYAIGYVGLGYLDEEVITLGISKDAGDFVQASVEAVLDETYPIARNLYMYTDGVPTGIAKNYIDFMKSPFGQAIAANESFVPVGAVGLLPEQVGDLSDSTLVIEGSTTVQPIATAAAEDFMDIYTGTTITVTGSGSSSGIAALIAGTVDIGMASREMKDSEKLDLPTWYETTVASDGIGIILHPDNTITQLTLGEVEAIYLGNITNWSELGGADAEIIVVNRDASSGTRGFFQEFVLEDADFVSGTVEQNSNGGVHDYVATNENAIGYVGLGYIDEEVSALAISSSRTIGDYTTDDETDDTSDDAPDDDTTTTGIPGYTALGLSVVSLAAVFFIIKKRRS